MKSRHMSESSDGFESPIGRVIVLLLVVIAVCCILERAGVPMVWPT
jgi:hypothetical protein